MSGVIPFLRAHLARHIALQAASEIAQTLQTPRPARSTIAGHLWTLSMAAEKSGATKRLHLEQSERFPTSLHSPAPQTRSGSFRVYQRDGQA